MEIKIYERGGKVMGIFCSHNYKAIEQVDFSADTFRIITFLECEKCKKRKCLSTFIMPSQVQEIVDNWVYKQYDTKTLMIILGEEDLMKEV